MEFWCPETSESTFLLLSATSSVVICPSSPRTQIQEGWLPDPRTRPLVSTEDGRRYRRKSSELEMGRKVQHDLGSQPVSRGLRFPLRITSIQDRTGPVH